MGILYVFKIINSSSFFFFNEQEAQLSLSQGNQRPSKAGNQFNRSRRDELIGKSVKIRKGLFKGHLATVKQATENRLRVALQTRRKVVSINRADCRVVDTTAGALRSQDRSSSSMEPHSVSLMVRLCSISISV